MALDTLTYEKMYLKKAFLLCNYHGNSPHSSPYKQTTMPNTHKMATTPFKDLSSYQNGQWIWHSLSTTEFPYSRLTHSYISEKTLGTLPITVPEKIGLCACLASTCLVNLGLLCHSVNKARKIGKGNTKVVKRWLRISSSLAHILVSFILFSTLIQTEVSPALASLWHISIILSLQVCSSHGLLVLLDKWIQVCFSTSGTTTVLEPIHILFILIFIGLWATSSIAGFCLMLSSQFSSFDDKVTLQYFHQFLPDYYIAILVICVVSMVLECILTFSALRWLVFIQPELPKWPFSWSKKKCIFAWIQCLFETEENQIVDSNSVEM